MTISLKKEPEKLRQNFGCYEKCFFCKATTKHWHENTNNPVCPDCAKTHKVAELPDHGRRIRADKRKKRKAAKS